MTLLGNRRGHPKSQFRRLKRSNEPKGTERRIDGKGENEPGLINRSGESGPNHFV